MADVTEIAILTAYQHNTICVSKQRRSPSLFPVNRASGNGVSFLGQLHLYLDICSQPRSAGCCSAAVQLFRRTSASEAPPRATRIAAAGCNSAPKLDLALVTGSSHRRLSAGRSLYSRKRTLVQACRDVRFVPLADIAQAWARFIRVPDKAYRPRPSSQPV